MAAHFAETGEFFAPVCPLMDYYYPQSKAYGPGYFILLGFVFKIFEFGMVQMRTPALLFGFAFLLLGYRMLRESGVSEKLSGIFFILLLIDPIFMQNIHSGRMDSTALFFAGLGALFAIRATNRNNWPEFGRCGLFLGFAILCTPRIAVNIIGPGLASLMILRSSPDFKKVLKVLLIPLIVGLIYTVWIFWGFGGFSNAWAYFFGQPREKLYYESLAQGYISFEKYIPVFQFPALLVLVILIITWLFGRRKVNPLQLICVFNLMAYFFLVRDTGIYSIFSIPWAYMLMASIGASLNLKSATAGRLTLVFSLLICLNAGIFLTKQLVIAMDAPSRDEKLVSQAIGKIIPSGSHVIGDEVYYYAAVKNGLKFQYLDRGASGFQRLSYHKVNFNFEYIIVRDPVSNPAEFKHYSKSIPLRKIGEISLPSSDSALKKSAFFLLNKFGIRIPAGYRGAIYQR